MTAVVTPCEHHRLGLRVQVHYGRRHFSDGCGWDLSSESIWVRIPALTLPVGTEVDLDLECLKASTGAAGRPIHARVVDLSAEGVLLAFTEPQPHLADGLADFTATPMPPPTPAGPRVLLQRPGR